ncbi:MAG: LTA synthase family protein [Lachnospiraceae bacterium]|nr:LTA synthase family protein [Lachnospiraceae bacterium]
MGEKLIRFGYFPLVCIFSELVLRLCIYRGFPEGTVAAVFAAAGLGCVWNLLTLCFSPVLNRIFFYLGSAIVGIYACVQLIYFTVFNRFFSIRLAMTVGTDVLDFKDQIFQTIGSRWYGIVLLLTPLLLRIVLDIGKKGFRKLELSGLLWNCSGTLLSCLAFFFLLLSGGKEAFSPWDLYFHEWEASLGTQQLGFFVAAGKDVKNVFSEDEEDYEDILLQDIEELNPATGKVTPIAIPTRAVMTPEPGHTGENVPTGPGENQEDEYGKPTEVPAPTPTPVLYQVQYDFDELAQGEKNETIRNLHLYFGSQEASACNEYTGMFEGYNLIMLTAEGFSPWAVDKELTPTLYKMTHSGFVFENFYTPLWYTSTSDGEYVACTGLLPDGSNSMSRSAENDMRLAFGNQFAKEGYKTLAYHNHTYTYYNRHLSHPNLGYTYKGIGNGLKLPTDCWPRSDYEMMQATVPEYIGQEPFHVYYMTVSGHMSYTFVDNTMSNRNRSVVKEMPYSDNARAYLACNYELEKALTYLLEELEKAGIAERTVIALSADHYPYGLDKMYIDELAGHEVEENFELYKNHFILWCAGMEETVTVSKYCSSLDIAPTIANLFGLSYDSRLYMGTDILSDKEGFVIFDNKSFLTDCVAYDAKTRKATSLTGEEISKEYLERKILEVKQKFAASKGTLVNDYYSYLPKLSE